jgi:protein-S-isoprenylcysteine O-methyltransferase Ste14
MRWLELRVPPPAVGLAIALLMWLAALATPSLDFGLPGRGVAVLAIAAGGVCIGATAFLQFRKTNTTVNPMTPEASSALVVAGIFRWTRNPMYLGMLVVLIAWALWLSNALAFIVLPLFVAYLNRFQILPEERALQARFGAEFERYCRSVRRWL